MTIGDACPEIFLHHAHWTPARDEPMPLPAAPLRQADPWWPLVGGKEGKDLPARPEQE